MDRGIQPFCSDREDIAAWCDAGSGLRIAQVVIGECVVTGGLDRVLVTTLGSCVAACASDPVAAIGGMNHFLLPTSPEGLHEGVGGGGRRYGRPAMDHLIEVLVGAGCRRERLAFKVFGAGRVIPCRFDIAGMNTEFILSYLRQEGLALAGQDLGGTFARRIFYYPATGRVMRRVLRPDALSETVNQALDFLLPLPAEFR